ncbi:MAG: tRNA (guanosine(46)-N7)-methyltransferase TrmB [Ruminiclostridium sp.]|nr:tRNA (guanosine(46)-N7)-methyltransferase TrmB [Ruminiclostridium sp.]
MRMRRKKNLGPRMEACGAWQIKEPGELRGNWRSLMPEARELRLELGCGKGRFTCQTAAAHPDILFVAVERVPDAMVMAMEKARNMGLTNVFYVDADAALLPEFFAEGEVDLIYINFCDPWPPKRHAKRRLTHRNFLKLYRQVLKEKGEIHFKTDNAPLFAFSVLEFPEAGYDLEEVTWDLHANGICGIMTDYEEKFHNLGTKINRCVGIKGELPPQEETPDTQS